MFEAQTMDSLLYVDWSKLLVPKLSLAEIVLRGVAVYVGLCLLLRVVLKRQAGKVALSDLLVVTVVAGACRNPLVADAYSLSDGLGVIIVVLCTSYALDWVSYYSRLVHRLCHPPPVVLVRDGVVDHAHLQQELLTEQQLRSKLRSHGVGDPVEVAEAWIEGDGSVSVLKRNRCPKCGQATG